MCIKQTITSGDYTAVESMLADLPLPESIDDIVFWYNHPEDRWEVYAKADLDTLLLYQDGGWVEG
jgi:hypothetical protein